MNIRSVSNPPQVLAKDKVEASKTIKSDETDEREANGQQPFADPDQYRPLTDDEIEEVLGKIRSNDGIKKNGLLVKLYNENNQKIIKIEAPDGKVIKRFVEKDLYFFLYQGGEEDIHLVNKSA